MLYKHTAFFRLVFLQLVNCQFSALRANEALRMSSTALALATGRGRVFCGGVVANIIPSGSF